MDVTKALLINYNRQLKTIIEKFSENVPENQLVEGNAMSGKYRFWPSLIELEKFSDNIDEDIKECTVNNT